MSKLITNTVRHTAGSADNITLDSSQNVTVEGNLTVDGTAVLTGTVTLPDNTVTLAKMAGGTDGQIITYDANGDPVAVGPGTDGQVLTSTGAGSPPAFETLPTSGATLSGSTNNTIVTVTGSNAMAGEANLTFDGNHLAQTVDASGEGFNQTASGNHSIINEVDSNRSAADNDIRVDTAKWNGTAVTEIHHVSGADTTNKDDGYLTFGTASAGSVTERMRITSGGSVIVDGTDASAAHANNQDFVVGNTSQAATGMSLVTQSGGYCSIVMSDGQGDKNKGLIAYNHNGDTFKLCNDPATGSDGLVLESDNDVKVATGNLVIGTSGKGVDFSATAHYSTTGDGEVLTTYEEGTWTPQPMFGGANTGITGQFQGNYVRVGKMVTAYYELIFTSKGSATGNFSLGGFPFSNAATERVNPGWGYYHRGTFDEGDDMMITCNISGTTSSWRRSLYGSAPNAGAVSQNNFADSTHIAGSMTYTAA